MTRRERLERRADRLRDWSGGRRKKSAASFEAARKIADGIPLGQPILVGHHSESRHRRDVARIDNGMRKGVEHEKKANSMESRAAGIDDQLQRSIYSDDADAVEQLKARIEGLETQRDRMKAVNKLIRAKGLQAALPELTDDEKRELLQLMHLTPYYQIEKKGYPPYALTNLTGNINRQKQRLKELSGGNIAGVIIVNKEAQTATGRAGLTVTQEMTTPSRPGKQPRPVWVVRGNLAPFRGALLDLDGRWYRGAFSFWEDPTVDIERLCAQHEAETASTPTATSTATTA